MKTKLLPILASALCTLTANATIRYVDVNSATPTSPYTNWMTAATNIQNAVNVASTGDEIVVTNGVYETGGASFTYGGARVVVSKPVTVRSVNGPQATVIKGEYDPATTNGFLAIRCAYLSDGAVLAGFTLTNGATFAMDDPPIYEYSSGGGVWATSWNAVISNCIISGNVAYRTGGGAFSGTLINCAIANNSAWIGGGAARNTLKNCVLTNNLTTAPGWGAGFAATFVNCTLVGNNGGGAAESYLYNSIDDSPVASHLFYSCAPYVGYGPGNITNAPLFVDEAGGNLRLQSNSPCINAGKNSYATNGTDFGGIPRIEGGTVDMGAYEFQTPSSVLSYAWAQQYGLPTDGSADFTDPDGDGMNTWREWRSGTDPTNALSVLKIVNMTNNNPGLSVIWQSAGRYYWIERSTNLGGQPPFFTLKSNIFGQTGTTNYTDTNAVGNGPFFYRVGVHE